MLYASTKATLKQEFGTGILYDFFADSIEDMSVEHFVSWIEEKSTPKQCLEDAEDYDPFVGSSCNVMTSAELGKHDVKQAEFQMSLSKNEK